MHRGSASYLVTSFVVGAMHCDFSKECLLLCNSSISTVPHTLDWDLPVGLSWVNGVAFMPWVTIPGVNKVHPRGTLPIPLRCASSPLLSNPLDLNGSQTLYFSILKISENSQCMRGMQLRFGMRNALQAEMYGNFF